MVAHAAQPRAQPRRWSKHCGCFCEGMQWRELRATGDRVCGATLRRRLGEWSAEARLHRGHAMRVRIVRSGPEAAAAAWDVVIDSCRVRAKRGGELTGLLTAACIFVIANQLTD
jgi:hypothetical protein